MKSILAIETPNSCVTCPLSHPCKYVNTYFVKEEIIIERLKKNYDWQAKQMCEEDLKPDWCPLSPLPLKKDLTKYIMRGDGKSMTHLIQYIHDQGYNDCLEEILGDKDVNWTEEING